MIKIQRILGALCLFKRAPVVAALMGVGLLVVGCGQKGPLYLPTSAQAQVKPSPSAMKKGAEAEGQPAR